MAQFVYFTVLLVLCGTANSLETTTSPQQQNTGDTKEFCEKTISAHGFPGIPGSNGMPGMPGIPGPQGPQGRDGVKGQTGDKGSQGMLGEKGEKGNEGPRGKSGPPGMMGMKGTRGTIGDQGMKGDKGEKGESAVPQTNWKQCVWKNLNDDRDSGKIKVVTLVHAGIYTPTPACNAMIWIMQPASPIFNIDFKSISGPVQM